MGLSVLTSLEEWASQAARADLIALAWSDDAIENARTSLPFSPSADQTVIHFSGLLNAKALGISDAELGSIHPLAACATPENAKEVFRRGPLVLEGSPRAVETLENLAKTLGAQTSLLSEGQKTRYHAGAVLASNALVGLLHTALKEWQASGLEDAQQLLLSLSQSALSAVSETDLQRGLTGPLKRGDIGSIRLHLEALDGRAETIYRLLHLKLIELLGDQHFDETLRNELETLLKP